MFRIIVPLDETLCGVVDSAVDEIPTQTTQTSAQPEEGQDAVGVILGLIMADQGITQKAIADKLSMNVNTVKYYIRKMPAEDILAREGTSHRGRWIVKLG